MNPNKVSETVNPCTECVTETVGTGTCIVSTSNQVTKPPIPTIIPTQPVLDGELSKSVNQITQEFLWSERFKEEQIGDAPNYFMFR